MSIDDSMDRGFAKRGEVHHEYVIEADCDANMEMVLRCVHAFFQVCPSHSLNAHSILDYAAEKEIDDDDSMDRRFAKCGGVQQE